MARVTLERVQKVYPGGVEAIPEISLEIPDGSFTVLVGPSGCGKSTLLRMIAGLEKVSAGTVRIGDRVVNDVEPKDRNIAMVFQNYALYPHMSVRSNLAFGLRLAGAPQEEIDRRIAETAAILGLDALLDRRPGALSGGQRQRVALGRAMVRKPEVFLYDEPLSNLDAKLRVHTRTEIARLHQRMGSTSVYVTHDQTEAMTMASQIVVLKDGRVQQIGAPIDVYARPENLFVAGFIGSPAMNFLPATIRRGAAETDPRGRRVVSGPRLEGDGFVLGMTEAMSRATAGRPEGPVILGIRPEHLRDRMEMPDAPTDHVVTATVEVVEPLGSETLVHVAVGGRPLVVRFEGRSAPSVQAPIDLVLDLSEAHLFDPATEARIA